MINFQLPWIIIIISLKRLQLILVIDQLNAEILVL